MKKYGSMNLLIEEGQELNDKFLNGQFFINTITMISEGKELMRKFHREYEPTEKDFKSVIPNPLLQRIDGYEQIPLNDTLWSMFYIGLSIGNRIRYDGKFQWEIEEEKEMAEWLSRQNSENQIESE